MRGRENIPVSPGGSRFNGKYRSQHSLFWYRCPSPFSSNRPLCGGGALFCFQYKAISGPQMPPVRSDDRRFLSRPNIASIPNPRGTFICTETKTQQFPPSLGFYRAVLRSFSSTVMRKTAILCECTVYSLKCLLKKEIYI